jgi:hypothetical protein
MYKAYLEDQVTESATTGMRRPKICLWNSKARQWPKAVAKTDEFRSLHRVSQYGNHYLSPRLCGKLQISIHGSAADMVGVPTFLFFQ